MPKRKPQIDLLAEYIQRTQLHRHKGIGGPPPWLGIKPAEHPSYTKRDALILTSAGTVILIFALLTSWAAIQRPTEEHIVRLALILGITAIALLCAGVRKWTKLHKRN